MELFTKEGKLVAGLQKSAARVRAFGASVTALGSRIATIGLTAGAGLLFTGKLFADMGSDMLDMSQRTGVGVEALSELRFAAQQSGASVEDLENAIKFMQRGGFGRGAEDLERIADELAGMTDPAQRTARAMEIFGRAGTRMLPMLLGGAAGLRRLREEARRTGNSMTQEQAEAAEAFGDAISKLTGSIKMAAFQVGAALAPALKEVAEWLTNAAAAAGKWVRENQEIVRIVALAVGALTGLGLALMVLGPAISAIGVAIGLLGTAISALIAGIGFILTPLGAVVALLTAAIGLWATFTRSGQTAINVVGDALRELPGIASASWRGVLDAIAIGDLQAAMQIVSTGVQLIWATMLGRMRVGWANLLVELRADFERFRIGVLAAVAAVGGAGRAASRRIRDSGALGQISEDAAAQVRINNAAAENNAALADLQAELNRLIQNAARARADHFPFTVTESMAEDVRPAALPDLLQRAEARGTFSAFAISGLGASSVTDRMAADLTAIRENTGRFAQPQFT